MTYGKVLRAGSGLSVFLIAGVSIGQIYCSDLVVANSKLALCFLLVVLIETVPKLRELCFQTASNLVVNPSLQKQLQLAPESSFCYRSHHIPCEGGVQRLGPYSLSMSTSRFWPCCYHLPWDL